ncbi:MAG: cytochrome C, partial [Deltaproteobacteria bacterium]|nr:cytochrome C [Deltaproteobacteria bacterium]
MRFMRIGALSASGIAVMLAAMVSIGCGPQQTTQVSQAPASSTAYTPTGKKDEYLTFASGGHGGNMVVIGVPSMRILKYVGVFTPEPWQGYGYGDQSGKVLEMGSRFGKEMTWGDMHHPALSETAGDYDGKFVFVNDKANARIAVVDLHDFVTKQIVTSQL